MATIQHKIFCVCEFIKTESQLTLLHGFALGERSSGGIWKFRTSFFEWYVDHSHAMYSSGNTDVRNWVHLFESAVFKKKVLFSSFFGALFVFNQGVHNFCIKHLVNNILNSSNTSTGCSNLLRHYSGRHTYLVCTEESHQFLHICYRSKYHSAAGLYNSN